MLSLKFAAVGRLAQSSYPRDKGQYPRPSILLNENPHMAVQKSRKTPSRRGMRRSHDGLSKSTLSTDPVSGELHRRHHVTADGYYRGRKLIRESVSSD